MKRFFLAVLILMSFIIATGPLHDPDLWWHIKTGEMIIATGSFPTKDVFSFTSHGNRWRAYSWLPQTIFYLTSKFGYFALIVLRIFILSIISTILYFFIGKIINNSQFAALAVFLGWGSSYPVWELRPHIFSFLFISAVCGILALKYIKLKDITPLLPLIFLVWANSHIYFVVGIFLVFAFILIQFIEKKKIDFKLLALFFICILVTLLNPYVLGIYSQFWELATHSWTWSWVMEMERPYPWDSQVFAFWIFVLAAIVFVFVIRKKVSFLPLFFVFFPLMYSLTALRHIAFFPLISLPFFGVLLRNSGVNLPPPSVSIFIKRFFIFTLAVVFFFRFFSDYVTPIAKSVPVGASEFIKERKPPPPIANFFDYGGYFIYKLWPEYKVFMDGRTQVFSREFLDEYAVLLSREVDLEKAVEIFRKYGINTIIWPSEHPLTLSLSKEGFRAIYRDKTTVIMEGTQLRK